jgi:hypothetical protein
MAAGGTLAHPAEAKPCEDNGQKEGSNADGLQDEVGQPCANQSGPVVGRASSKAGGQTGGVVHAGGESADCVRGGVGWRVGGQCE